VTDHRPGVPDSLTVQVQAGVTALVVSDLHLRARPTASSLLMEAALAQRLGELSTPTLVVLAGDIVELLGEPGLRPADAFCAHPALTAALRRVADRTESRVVYLVGNHDADLAWDVGEAAEVRSAIGADLALDADLLFATPRGEARIRVEHGNRFDLYNRFRDIRNPLDTPLGHHIVSEVLPLIQRSAPDWLDGASDMADPADFPSFVGSRLAYRRLAVHLSWLLIPIVALLVVLRVPILLLPTKYLPEDVQDWVRRSVLLAGVLVLDVLLMIAVVAILVRRAFQALRSLALSERGYGQNDAARDDAARLLAEGYVGLVCGHSHRPELAALRTPSGGIGFFANSGSGTEVVESTPGRLGMPPVYLSYHQVSWLELSCAGELLARLIVAEVPMPGATRLERLIERRPRPTPREPAVVACWPASSWP
jgi:UDP-2,3-diacylglucosamine pyrophosphatase LpxH